MVCVRTTVSLAEEQFVTLLVMVSLGAVWALTFGTARTFTFAHFAALTPASPWLDA